MLEWFLTGWRILVLRLGPQDLPGSRQWTFLALGLYLLTGAGLAHLRDLPHPLLGLLALDVLITVVLFYSFLSAWGRGHRLPQCLQAVWLCGSWLNLMGMPFAPILAGAEGEPSLWLDVAVVANLTLLFWSLSLLAHIFRHALEWTFYKGLLLALVYSAINIASTLYVFPPNG